jgi:hypothetical protein
MCCVVVIIIVVVMLLLLLLCCCCCDVVVVMLLPFGCVIKKSMIKLSSKLIVSVQSGHKNLPQKNFFRFNEPFFQTFFSPLSREEFFSRPDDKEFIIDILILEMIK